MKNATKQQQAAAAAILLRLQALVPSGIETDAHADCKSIAADPSDWDYDAAAWALSESASATAEWTQDGYEDPACSAIADAANTDEEPAQWWAQNEDTNEGCLLQGIEAFEPERAALAGMGAPDTERLVFLDVAPEDRDSATAFAYGATEAFRAWLRNEDIGA